jgi:ubiquinone/menaquinone biosynthesis C-methylase UbiE
LGGWITGRGDAYQYLQKSSSKFPCGDQFVGLMNSTGLFSSVTATPVFFGAAYIYTGVRR